MYYTATYLEKLIGLPAEECRRRCVSFAGRFDLNSARRAKAQYDAERAAVISARRNIMAQGLCIHRVGNDYCRKPAATTGVPYCIDHLPPSHQKRIRKKKAPGTRGR